MTVLSNIFSREKALFYFCMWDESDRMGYARFANHKIHCNLFLRAEPAGKTSVWYANKEMEEFRTSLSAELRAHPDLLRRMSSVLEEEWSYIGPYVQKTQVLQTIDEFLMYYKHLVRWWSAMTVLFHIPDLTDLGMDLREQALALRSASEKYTERMNEVMSEYWEHAYPQYRHVTNVLKPEEAGRLACGQMPSSEYDAIQARLQGFGMLDGQIYLLSELQEVMSNLDIHLEKQAIGSANEILGVTACQGCVQGRVRLVQKKTDIDLLKSGEVLVTHMTNPNFVTAMKRAVAIVTDEGGLTCHAAIISRELNIPCIIGTKVATQVFTTGDIVEVNANTGVVRKLSS